MPDFRRGVSIPSYTGERQQMKLEIFRRGTDLRMDL
jgi:hypothetical protein